MEFKNQFEEEMETGIDEDGKFSISITEESDCSLDGGYTFEDTTNVYHLTVDEAKILAKELQEYIESN